MPHPLLKAPTNAWAPYTSYTAKKYATPSQCLVDVYVPNNGWSQCPPVLAVHGGGWNSGSRTDNLLLFLPLIMRGFAVASVDYRLSQVAKWPAQSVDVAQCVKWLTYNAASFRLWNGGVFLWGGSAGAHLAALTGSLPATSRYVGTALPNVSSKPLMTCLDFPPANLTAWLAGPSDVNNGSMVDGLLGLPRTAAKLEEASPVTWVAAGNSPLILRHGTSDTTVPFSQSQELFDLVHAAGVDSTLQTFVGAKHADSAFYSTAEINNVADRFETRLYEVAP